VLEGAFDKIGATLHLLTERIDGGPVVAQARPVLDPRDDARTLEYKVHDVAHRLFVELLRELRAGNTLAPKPQDLARGRVVSSRAFTPAHRDIVRRLLAGGAIARHLERAQSSSSTWSACGECAGARLRSEMNTRPRGS